MSEIKVNKISPRTNCGTTQLGDSGDTFNLPSGATLTVASGATITNNGTQTGFGRTGTVDWDTTPKTATFSAVSGDGFFCNTTSSAFTCNLPAGSAGAIVSLADYAGTWQTNGLTVSPNGSEKIGGVNADVVLSTEGQSVTLVYVDSTQGWLNIQDSTSNVRGNSFVAATGGTETTVCTNFKVHTFTGPGTFTVTNAGAPSGSTTVDYLVIAGGGNGGGDYGGGGGAGGYRFSNGTASGCYAAGPSPLGASALPVSVQGYPITVGAGGTGSGENTPGNNGSNSIFSSITSTGGGRGGTEGPDNSAGNGGSGGGAMRSSTPTGNGNSPPVTPPQGNPGGAGANAPGYAAGGGGGAGATGQAAPSNNDSGDGGAGLASSITGSPVTRGGGGGGAGGGNPQGQPYTAGSGGPGGGGSGVPASCTTNPGTPGTVNTGGGGGGAALSGPSQGGNGGSGVVVIRYKFQ